MNADIIATFIICGGLVAGGIYAGNGGGSATYKTKKFKSIEEVLQEAQNPKPPKKKGIISRLLNSLKSRCER